MVQNPESCPQYPDRSADDLCNISLQELIHSREHQRTPRGDTWILHWAVFGTDDECLVEKRVENDTFGIYKNFRMEQLREWSAQRAGQHLWIIRAVYGYGAYPAGFRGAPNNWRPVKMQLSTAGGTEKLLRAIDTIDSSADAPDVQRAIEWDGEKIKGVDSVTSKTRWRETWKMSFDAIYTQNFLGDPIAEGIQSYYHELYGLSSMSLWERWDLMTGWVHGIDGVIADDYDIFAYRGYAPGSIMFNGATMTQLDDWNFEVTFEFQYEANTWADIPNTVDTSDKELTWPPDEPTARLPRRGEFRSNPKVSYYPDSMTGDDVQIYKYGHDYLQFFYEEQDSDPGDGDGKVTLQVPVHYIYQQVKRYVPFEYLGVTNNLPLRNPQGGQKWDCDQMIGYTMPHQGNQTIQPTSERSGTRWESAACGG